MEAPAVAEPAPAKTEAKEAPAKVEETPAKVEAKAETPKTEEVWGHDASEPKSVQSCFGGSDSGFISERRSHFDRVYRASYRSV